MAVENGRLHEPNGGDGDAARESQQGGQVALDAGLESLEGFRGVAAIAAQEIEAELLVEDGARPTLEGEEADGLLFQLVEAGLAALAGRLEDVGYGTLGWERAGQAGVKEGQGDGGGMSDDVERVRGNVEAGRLEQGSAEAGAGVVLEGLGEVEEEGRVRGAGDDVEGQAGGGGGTGQEGRAGAGEVVLVERRHDHGFAVLLGERAGLRGVGADQLDADRETCLGQHLANLAADERAAPDDGDES